MDGRRQHRTVFRRECERLCDGQWLCDAGGLDKKVIVKTCIGQLGNLGQSRSAVIRA